jgi:hypothetical protein
MAYAEIEPFGETRADMRAGVIASANANLYRKKGKPPLRWQQYFPQYEDRVRAGMGWQDMLALVEALNTELGGVDKRKHRPPAV